MNQRSCLCLSLLITAFVVFAGCDKKEKGNSATTSNGSGGKLTIAVIPKGTTHEFWKSIEAGARQAGEELGVEIKWKGPVLENDRAEQIKIVEQFASEGVSGIVLAPLDDTALRRPVQEATDNKVPVVIIDSALKGEAGKDFVSFISTDNKQGGVMAGDKLAKLLDGKGKVVMLRYQEGSASTMDREAGFLKAVGKNPGISVTVQNRFGGPTSDNSKTTSLEMLDKIKEADGIFCSNESTTFGMLLALRQEGLTKKAKFVGFDTSSNLMEGLRNGEIDALIAQNPKKMGYEGVRVIVDQLRGKKVEQRIDSGVKLLTSMNLNDPEIMAFLGMTGGAAPATQPTVTKPAP